MADGKLKDPADKGKAKREERDAERRILSIDDIDPGDLKPLPATAARTPHPFEGYPEKMMKVGTWFDKADQKEKDLVLNATHIVMLNPSYVPPQDPSGENVAIDVLNDARKVIRVENRTIESAHNRVTTYRGDSFNAVFDRELTIRGVTYKYAIIPEPAHRAQIMFSWNSKAGRIEVDRRYILLDGDQKGRIRQVFQIIINPKLQVEKIAGAIAGETAESLDDLQTEPGGLEG